MVNDYFLVRTTPFDPRGALSDEDIAAEHISGMRWWRHEDIVEYGGPDLFSPRDTATPLTALIAGHLPAHTSDARLVMSPADSPLIAAASASGKGAGMRGDPRSRP